MFFFDREFWLVLTWAVMLFAPTMLVVERLIKSPHGGRYQRDWGPRINRLLGWMIMESPAVIGFAIVVALGENRLNPVAVVLTMVWLSHYVDRTFTYPLRTRPSDNSILLMVVASAFVYNSINAYINAAWVGHFGSYDVSWFGDPRFLLGVLIFYVGFWINRKADAMLKELREDGDSGYKIPRGWLYESISCPNYFGEIVMWFGWAVASWSLPGLAFAVFTACNLGARAVNHHHWYKETFDDYPNDRHAVLPGLI